MQGDRCDLTRLWADRGHHWLRSWDQDGISNAVCHGGNTLILWVAESHRINVRKEHGRDAAQENNMQSLKRAPACKDRVENSAPFWHLQRKIWVADPTSEQHDIEQLKGNILKACVHSLLNGKNGEKKQQTPTSLWAVLQPLCLAAPTSVTTTPESGRI